MRIHPEDLTLYAVTDRSWIKERTLVEQIEEALEGGITFLQLREKHLPEDQLVEEAKKIKELTNKYQVPFIINDNIALARKVDADGVHLGQDDMNVREARKLLGPDKIIGVSAHNVVEALEAQEGGADYLGVGAVHVTSTKEDANKISTDEIRKICDTVKIPVVGIGGIKKDNIQVLKGTGVDGVAVVSAIFAAEDITNACMELRKCVEEMKKL